MKTNRNRRRRNAKINRIAGTLDRKFGDRRNGLEDALDFVDGRKGYHDLRIIDTTQVREHGERKRWSSKRFRFVIGDYFFHTWEMAEAFRRTNHFFWDNVELSGEMGVIPFDGSDYIAFATMAISTLGKARPVTT